MLFFFCLLIQTCIYHYRGKFAMESKKSCRCKIIWESPESSYPFLWQTSVYIYINYPHLCHRMQGCSWEYEIFQLTFNQECEEHSDFPVIEFSTLRKFLFFLKFIQCMIDPWKSYSRVFVVRNAVHSDKL